MTTLYEDDHFGSSTMFLERHEVPGFLSRTDRSEERNVLSTTTISTSSCDEESAPGQGPEHGNLRWTTQKSSSDRDVTRRTFVVIGVGVGLSSRPHRVPHIGIHRRIEACPMCSLFKVLAVAGLLIERSTLRRVLGPQSIDGVVSVGTVPYLMRS